MNPSFGRDGRLLRMLGLQVSDVLKPEFARKVTKACNRKPGETAMARAILLDETARFVYLKFGFLKSPRHILEIEEASPTQAAVKKAIRRLQMRVHPDKWRTGDCPILEEFAKECIQMVNRMSADCDEDCLDIDDDAAEAEEMHGDVDSESEAREFYGKKGKKKRKRNDPVEENVTVMVSLRDLIRGVTDCPVKLLSGASMSIGVPAGTVPGWSTSIRAPGRPPVRVVVDVKPESMRGYSIDDSKRLRVEVDVPMDMAFCGRGQIEADAPNGQKFVADVTVPVEEGDEIAFKGGGFCGEPMIGTVRVRNPRGIGMHLRRDVWNILHPVSNTHNI